VSNSNGKAAAPTFDLDAAIADADLTPFRFTFAGQEWELPHLGGLDAWPMIAAAESGDTEAALAVMRLAFGDRWEDFHAIPLPQVGLNALFERYVAHSGMAPGKPLASTGF
jgi:hypothetical protein